MTYLDPRPSPRPPRRRKPQHSWEREALVIVGVVALFLAVVTWVSLNR
jgi:predicted anti-sigma-YlaC factor YlaD